MRRILIFLLFISTCIFGQSSDLIRQQYRKGLKVSDPYNQFNYRVHVYATNTTVTDREVIPQLATSYGFSALYKLSFSAGIELGVSYLKLKYQYSDVEDQSIDDLGFITVPLGIAFFPADKFNISAGAVYNISVLPLNITILDDQPVYVKYQESKFPNTFGVYARVNYRLRDKLFLEVGFRFQRKNIINFERESNNFNTLIFGITYSFRGDKNKKRRKKVKKK